MNRKFTLLKFLTLVSVLSMALAACVPAQTGGGAAAPAAPAAPAARTGKDLKIIYWQAPTILNPHQASGTKDYDAGSVILEPLASYDQNDELVPKLAAEIPTVENGGVAADGTSVTWKLREGVKWSDGSDFTADDVVFTYTYCSTPETACTNKARFDPIGTVEAVDPLTVKVTWKEPNANAYGSFTTSGGVILQKKQFENCVGAVAITDEAC